MLIRVKPSNHFRRSGYSVFELIVLRYEHVQYGVIVSHMMGLSIHLGNYAKGENTARSRVSRNFFFSNSTMRVRRS